MIDVKGLEFGYAKKRPLFQGLNLKLEKGHIYGLLGKNGAGKSTLLKNITGLAFPTKGSCLYNGINVAKRPVSVLSDIYFLAEDLYTPSLTSEQFAASTATFYPKYSKSDFYHYLKVFDVDPAAMMDQQSFGQQKKALIAFGLATNTGLLILDEPTNGLDIPSKVQFRKLIASVLTENRCIVISTHQVRDLDNLIDTLLILNDREIVVNHSVDELVELLSFGVYPDTEGLSVLYEEHDFRGKNAILRNRTGVFSKLDLELLFNAVISGNTSVLDFIKSSK
ncbi:MULTISPECIES: ABC transporter ATP-binding protein [unclassified Mucilaginibacter]|uniref:ABC transporter ATP-binding protein n=1 Tax=unclassified Mucilaginibacter TaxID=2617802 RepID=UPI002AC8EBB1|nr:MULTISPECIES: ABC transporter ATP-binding protein [unclassified Mucilaginibacter]MEB0263888.1 ABC transporter ATP-binding protein [Mucilaginibacter sp. 10I4]MEB0279618.1 ABC transporter ATP-binding protein [Mucilaginibacter sp. 10B2]MEB0300320.1 ABC transporter ATP-binding protein [Mucilaginibacter sp. 5C4]WPX22515.1 ABC transporter ATP-binding protein [Mucilaginibacter sp. 5C4]